MDTREDQEEHRIAYLPYPASCSAPALLSLSAATNAYSQQANAREGPEKQRAPSSLLPYSFPSLFCCNVVALSICWLPLPWGLAEGCSNSAAVRYLLRSR